LKWGQEEVAQTKYTHVGKCENNKIKEKEIFAQDGMILSVYAT
jgi:hypothetical protein